MSPHGVRLYRPLYKARGTGDQRMTLGTHGTYMYTEAPGTGTPVRTPSVPAAARAGRDCTDGRVDRRTGTPTFWASSQGRNRDFLIYTSQTSDLYRTYVVYKKCRTGHLIWLSKITIYMYANESQFKSWNLQSRRTADAGMQPSTSQYTELLYRPDSVRGVQYCTV